MKKTLSDKSAERAYRTLVKLVQTTNKLSKEDAHTRVGVMLMLMNERAPIPSWLEE